MTTNHPPVGREHWNQFLWIPILAGGLIMGLALGVRHV